MKKITITLLLLIGIRVAGSACPFCNKNVLDDIYNSQFYPNLFTMLTAFLVLALILVILTVLSAKKPGNRPASYSNGLRFSPVPLTSTSMVLGIGIGGFIDGIVLHQILQVHEMLSNKIPTIDYVSKSVNMFWDGIFHFFCLLVVLLGIILMWKLYFRQDVDRSGKLLGGGFLLGWGLFNVVEGVINHQLLKLHNVIELSTNHDIGNFAFLGISVVMLLAGYIIVNNRIKNSYQTTASWRHKDR